MANFSDFLKSSTAKGAYGQPGSNGFWQRDVFSSPGTYTWTARKAGKVKVQGLGAACGGKGRIPGNSAGWGEKTFDVLAGQSITIVIGAGSVGTTESGTPSSAGTTSISGTPIGGTPLTLVGATSTAAGTASGPWDLSYPGAATTGLSVGGPSSGSPFGPGKATTSPHGSGWGGPSSNASPGSTHRSGATVGDGSSTFSLPTPGLLTTDGKYRELWDMRDADGASSANVASETSSPGPGVGSRSGSSASNNTFPSLMGGGTAASAGTSTSNVGSDGGFGSGGGAGGASGAVGGRGGGALVFVFYDEVF